MYKAKGKKTRPVHVYYNKVWLKFLIGFTKCEKILSNFGAGTLDACNQKSTGNCVDIIFL